MDKESAFKRFYIQNYDKLFSYVNGMLCAEHISEEVVQETFLEAWRKFEKLQGHPAPRGWLFQTAEYKVRNLTRKMKRRKLISFEQLEAVPEENRLDMKEWMLVLEKELTDEEQQWLQRYYVVGYSARELAALEGITENNFRVRLNRMLKKIRERMV